MRKFLSNHPCMHIKDNNRPTGSKTCKLWMGCTSPVFSNHRN